LGEGNRDGGIGREVEFGVSFAPIPEIRKFVYLRVVGGKRRGNLLDNCDIDWSSGAGLVNHCVCHSGVFVYGLHLNRIQ